ncbi:MAG: ABC-F family ATP-binding cassette domain-containing protein [Tissierellia bacterium]|nr:ABC-F family ATP-binding cassette domain-containing protein [Tissierellia bacterium]
MAEIAINKVSKSFGLNEIFKDLSFQINEKDKVGIVGPNGAGKTTLFNIITGKISPDSGEIFIKNGLKIAYMLQNVGIASEKTIFDYLLDQFQHIFDMEERLSQLEKALGQEKDFSKIESLTLEYNMLLEKHEAQGGRYYESKIEAVLKGLSFSEDSFHAPIKNLSGGEKSRVELAKLILSDADILLLDEPTNHLDMDAISFLEGYLRDFPKVVVIISHDRFFLDRVANRIFLLENKRLYVYNTNYTDFMKLRKKDLEVEERAYENQQKEIERQEAIIDKFLRAGKSLRKRGIAQARSRQKLLDRMKKLEKPDHFDDKMILNFRPERESGEDVLRVRDLSMAFEDKCLYKDVSFDIYKGQKIGLIGGNGTGKTTLFKIILNKLKATSGQVDLGVSVFPEYFDQQQTNLSEEKTVIDEIWDDYPAMTHYELRSYLAKFMFIGDDIFKTIDQLSGGERARITLLKLMLSSANFLLMDEPTNHLDIDSKEVLEQALIGYQGTAFIISHDRYFLNKVVDKIMVIADQGLEVFEGNYDYYLEKLEERKPDYVAYETVNKTQKTKALKRTKEEERKNRRIKADIRKLEGQMEEIDLEIEEINQKFADPKTYQDHEKSLDLQMRLNFLNEEKDRIFEVWAQLIEENEYM